MVKDPKKEKTSFFSLPLIKLKCDAAFLVKFIGYASNEMTKGLLLVLRTLQKQRLSDEQATLDFLKKTVQLRNETLFKSNNEVCHHKMVYLLEVVWFGHLRTFWGWIFSSHFCSVHSYSSKWTDWNFVEVIFTFLFLQNVYNQVLQKIIMLLIIFGILIFILSTVDRNLEETKLQIPNLLRSSVIQRP